MQSAKRELNASAVATARTTKHTVAMKSRQTWTSVKLLVRLVFNIQLIPVLSFWLIFATTVLLHTFFHFVSPQLRAQSLAGIAAASTLFVACFLGLCCVMRSLVYLAADPFLTVEHGCFLGKARRCGPVFTLLLGVAGTGGLLLGSFFLMDEQWTMTRHAQGVAVTVACHTLLAVVEMGLAGQTVTVEAWMQMLHHGKVAGLICSSVATVLAWQRTMRLDQAGAALVVNLFGSALAFAGLWIALETLLLCAFVWRFLFGRHWQLNSIKAALVVALTCWVAQTLNAWMATLLMIPPTSVLLSAYFGYLRSRSRDAARGKATPRADSKITHTVFAIVRVAMFAIFLAVALILAFVGRVAWANEPDVPVYGAHVNETSSVLRISHLGFDGPQSFSEYRLADAPHPGCPTASHHICMLQWHDTLNIYDLGLMAQMAYVWVDTPAWDAYTRLFPGWEMEAHTHAHNGVSNAIFVDLRLSAEQRGGQRGLTVISIRGTNNPADLLQDLDLWYAAGLLQLARALPTTLSLWPEDLLAEVVGMFDLVEKTLTPKAEARARHYYAPILDHIHQIRQGPRASDDLIITGHSLGGGLAKIVGGSFNVPAVSFSGPGLVLSRHKFGLTLDTLYRNVVNLVPTHDFVPRIDLQGGTTFHRICKFADPVLCHDPMNILEVVFDQCGSCLGVTDSATFIPNL